MLDVSGPAERTGKHRGTDLLDGTVTLPFILARTHDPELAAAPGMTPSEAEAICDRIAATGALEESRARALELVAGAKASLPDDLPPAQRRALDLVADSVVARYACPVNAPWPAFAGHGTRRTWCGTRADRDRLGVGWV
jgi:geranylgeranyl pyrophosphate synthase